MKAEPVSKFVNIACNLCARDETRLRYHKAGMNIVQCLHCGLVYVNPQLIQDEVWKRYSTTYFWEEYLPSQNAAGGQVNMAFHDQRARYVLDLVQPYCQQGRLLDLGCAAGFFLKAAERAGWSNVRGVEIMQSAVDFARECLRLDVFEGTLEQADYGDDFFDTVVMLETIEHLLDPKEVLEEVYRIVRPGGALVLTTPNLDSLACCLFGAAWSVLGPSEHLYYFTVPTMACMLEDVGFKRVQFTWPAQGIPWCQVINPYNVSPPNSLRGRLVKWLLLILGPLIYHEVAKRHWSDHLYVIAEK